MSFNYRNVALSILEQLAISAQEAGRHEKFPIPDHVEDDAVERLVAMSSQRLAVELDWARRRFGLEFDDNGERKLGDLGASTNAD